MRRAIAAALIASTMLAGLSAARAQPAAVDADAARSMDAAYIAVPVVRDGRLVNYIFVSLRVDIAPGVDLWRTREKAHFLRDALVRAAHRTPMVSPTDNDALDRPAALAAFRAAAQEALGARAVRGLSIVEVQSSRQTVAQR
jgi:hypothetical protein